MQASDLRVKCGIEQVDSAQELARICKLNLVSFEYTHAWRNQPSFSGANANQVHRS
jgi:hypothetical protein